VGFAGGAVQHARQEEERGEEPRHRRADEEAARPLRRAAVPDGWADGAQLIDAVEWAGRGADVGRSRRRCGQDLKRNDVASFLAMSARPSANADDCGHVRRRMSPRLGLRGGGHGRSQAWGRRLRTVQSGGRSIPNSCRPTRKWEKG
jgi:hypothetical protein